MRLNGVKLGTAFSRAARTRRGVAGIAAGLAAIGLALSAIGSGAPARAGTAAPGRAVPAAAISRLKAIAASFVKENGGHRPDWESAVSTTHGLALSSATPGDAVAGNMRAVVYLVTMKGHFIGYGAAIPPGARPPTGSYLSIVINATTYSVMDWGLSSKAPPVAPGSLGRVTMLMR
jgi:hypothetical protein